MSNPVSEHTTDRVADKKIAACAISLGVAIINTLVGDSIASSASDGDAAELMAAAINSEFKL